MTMETRMSGYAAISCKFLPPTNHEGTRIRVSKASCKRLIQTYPWDYELGTAENYEQAAKFFATCMGWSGNMVGAFVKTGAVFIFTNLVYEREYNEATK